MSKKNKSSQFPGGQLNAPNKPNVSVNQVTPNHVTNTATITSQNQDNLPAGEVKPEQNSLVAYQHIQTYLQLSKKSDMDKEDLNAVLRLSTHLRIFGLLSAVAYVNQQNAQEGKVRERTVPVWSTLLGALLHQPTDFNDYQSRRILMETVVKMARENPAEYMTNWRKSIILADQWNFWARAYRKE